MDDNNSASSRLYVFNCFLVVYEIRCVFSRNDVGGVFLSVQSELEARNHAATSSSGEGAPSSSHTAAADAAVMPATEMRTKLMEQWMEQKTPLNDRIDALVSLLDASKVTPQMISAYEAVQQKLSDRMPISQVYGLRVNIALLYTVVLYMIALKWFCNLVLQMLNRKQFIEYKLKLASRIGGEGSNGLSSADKALLITELTEIQQNLDLQIKRYEKKYGEPFLRPADGTTSGGAGNANNAASVTPGRSSIVLPNNSNAVNTPAKTRF